MPFIVTLGNCSEAIITGRVNILLKKIANSSRTITCYLKPGFLWLTDLGTIPKLCSVFSLQKLPVNLPLALLAK